MFAIFTPITIWADQLSNNQILIHCDNQTIVSVINAGTCKSSTIMTVIRKLFFVCARHNISILAKHVPGHFNDQADALSRLQVERFNHLHPTAATNPTSVPATIWNIWIMRSTISSAHPLLHRHHGLINRVCSVIQSFVRQYRFVHFRCQRSLYFGFLLRSVNVLATNR